MTGKQIIKITTLINNKLKNLFYTIAAAMTLAACSSEDNLTTVNEPENNLVPMTFTASQEGEAGTRAGLNADNRTKINWKAGDAISINGAQFTLSSGEDTETGSFSGTTAEVASYTAVYPYTGNETYVSEGQVSGVVLPSEQTATKNSFDPKAALMMAVSSNKTLEFKNAVGFIKVTPQFECKKIILRAANKAKPLAGKGTIKFDSSENPYIDFDGSSELSYSITLSGTITSGNAYYIAVPAGEYSANWTLTFVTENKNYMRQVNKSITFVRSKALKLGEFAIGGDYWVGPSGIVDPSQEVDLGLKIVKDSKTYIVKFANSNLTATGLAAKESDFGDYFAWAATEPWLTSYIYSGSGYTDASFTKKTWKTGYTGGYIAATAPFFNGSTNTKYETSGNTLEASDDAANVILGGDWQLPTKEIWKALYDANTTTVNWGSDGNKELETIDDSGIEGMKITKEGESGTFLFLPAAGWGTAASIRDVGDGNYWSGTVDSSQGAYSLNFLSGLASAQFDNSRALGYSVRPVRLVEVP